MGTKKTRIPHVATMRPQTYTHEPIDPPRGITTFPTRTLEKVICNKILFGSKFFGVREKTLVVLFQIIFSLLFQFLAGAFFKQAS